MAPFDVIRWRKVNSFERAFSCWKSAGGGSRSHPCGARTVAPGFQRAAVREYLRAFTKDLRYDFRGLPEQNYSLLCDRLQRALSDATRSFRYDLRIKEIIVFGSLAIVRLTWISTLTANGNSDTHEEPGLDVFQKQADGRWQIIRYIAYEVE